MQLWPLAMGQSWNWMVSTRERERQNQGGRVVFFFAQLTRGQVSVAAISHMLSHGVSPEQALSIWTFMRLVPGVLCEGLAQKEREKHGMCARARSKHQKQT